MVSEDQPRGRPGRKLTKKRRESRRVSLDIPERFKDGADADEDVTASKRNTAMSMNQSIFSMIARAGQQSQTDLGTMVEEDSEDSDPESKRHIPLQGLDGAARLSRISSIHDFHSPGGDAEGGKAPKNKHRRALSENKLLRSLPRLKVSGRKESKSEAAPAEQMSSSQFLPPRPSGGESPKPIVDEPPLRHKSRATPGEEIHVEKRRGSDRKAKQTSAVGLSTGKDSVTLAKRLQEIFEFGEVEDVISEYPCWLLQSILLQGYMYITQKHICFYAYIPRKHHDVSKTGYLSKRGRSKYNRYWFVLRGDVLSYYTNPADLYFPRNRINLQYAITAEVLESKDKNKDETTFVITTDQRRFQFKADSAVSAKEWVRSVQKVIFRTHNEGNSVKISLPIQNILETEESSMLDFADTVKVRVIDNDETFAIDEYFFAFFNHGQDALNVLRIMINDNEHHQSAQGEGNESASTPTVLASHGTQDMAASSPRIEENVRATLSPLPAPYVARTSMSADSRSSLDVARKSLDVRRSMDAGRALRRPSHEIRRSFSGGSHYRQSSRAPGDRSPLSPLSGEPKRQDTSDSATNSLGPGTESSAAIQSMDDSNASASQILGRSDVFRAPTLHAPGVAASEKSDSLARHSQDTTRSSSVRKTNLKSPHPSNKNPDPSGHRHASLGAPDAEDADSQPRLSGSSFTSYPLQKASGLAGFLRTRSKKMGNLLATESMGYYEKVSGMLAGGRKHYNVAEGLQSTDQVHGYEEDEDAVKAAENFREHFAFPESEQLQSSFFASLQRILPNYGKIYISGRYFCFRSLVPTVKTKIILPMRDIESVNKERGFRLGYHGLAVVIRGHEELFFEFSKSEYRDECAIAVLRIIESTKYIEDEESSSSGIDSDDEAAKAEHDLLQAARQGAEPSIVIEDNEAIRAADHDRVPLVFDDPLASIVDFKPSEPMTIVCLTIGSRGDVQPYIALCKDLLKEGHKPRIATHAEFEPWVRKHGIDFAPVDGNPAELMRICVEQGMFTVGFLMEANSKFRGWLDDVCTSAWKACQGADLLIESPSAMAGIHIAEALEIPYFRAFTMPWSRTRAYPHAFWVSEKSMGGAWNFMTYTVFDGVFWKAISGQVNKWRRRELGLQNTSLAKMQPHVRPFLYNFSPSVVSPPLDWPDWIRVTGYWFLDESDIYEPPAELVAFIAKAKEDGKALVYVGFGSIVIDDPAALTQTVVDSVLKADVRCVLSKGWSDRLETKDPSKPEVTLPPAIFQIKSAPHDWLFKQMDAAVHHGGSGTTGASLRAGIPTIIKPFFGDQFFFASRVEKLGVGIWLKKINTHVFAKALWEVTNSQRMIVRAKVLGQKIRKENGTQTAIQTIYRELDRARSQINKHVKKENEDTDEFEEDWTIVEELEEGQGIDVPQPHEMQAFQPQQPVQGLPFDASQTGRASLALGSMVMKGANSGTQQRGDWSPRG